MLKQIIIWSGCYQKNDKVTCSFFVFQTVGIHEWNNVLPSISFFSVRLGSCIFQLEGLRDIISFSGLSFLK